MVEAYQDSKRESGYLDFTDLLLYARDLLRHDGARPELQAQIRPALRRRIPGYRSPAGRDPDDAGVAGNALRRRRSQTIDLSLPPRRAARVFDVRERLLAAGAEEQRLAKSYRSTEPIQAFVNAAFDACIPDYLPISGGPLGRRAAPVVALPMPRPYEGEQVKANAILDCSPSTVAAFIDGFSGRVAGRFVRTRAAAEALKAEDICILFRRFTNNGVDLTQDYVRSLEARKIEHVLVGSKGLHAREETAAIRTALRAIEWPEDELSVYAVLHGPLFGIDDATLLRFREGAGKLRPYVEPPEDMDPELEPVWQAPR